MVNYIKSKYEDIKAHAEKNVLQNGLGYMWYISMITLGLLVYVIYSYMDNGAIHINIVYLATFMLSANAYIINTIETQKPDENSNNDTEK